MRPLCLALSTIAILTFVSSSSADDALGKLLFEDDFNRAEQDDSKEQIGKGWTTNSKSRANGNKQVDLVDGTVHLTMHETADHGVSFVHDAGFRNGTVALRLKLRKQDDFGINLADLSEKSVHAGHLCQVKFRGGKMQLMDLKTGQMRLDLRTKRKAGEKMSKEEQQLVTSKMQSFDSKLTPGQWHDVEMHIDGPRMLVKIDGEIAGEFESEGIAHPTKRKVRLAVGKQAWVDDVRIYSRDESK